MRISLILLAVSLLAACTTTAKGPAAKANATADAGAAAPANSTKVPNQPLAATSAVKIECSAQADVRQLELRPKGKGCELAYSKNGQEGIVASSVNGTSHCENTLNKIRDRLTGSGFECR